jgi:hypothetical protein
MDASDNPVDTRYNNENVSPQHGTMNVARAWI